MYLSVGSRPPAEPSPSRTLRTRSAVPRESLARPSNGKLPLSTSKAAAAPFRTSTKRRSAP
eukprot:6199499-Lingulodinium_polyedra.AAC.1